VVHNCALIPCVTGVARPDWESGESWFTNLSQDQQRRMMGASKYNAWRAGKFSLSDLVKMTHDPTWGASPGVKGLRELIM
jgi:hypothetical protein